MDAKYLICYGLLLCGGSPQQKAEEFYNVLQDGGLAAHKFIAASDKDLHPIFEKMCHLATVDLFVFARDFADLDNKYEDNMEALAKAHEDVREDMFLDEVYGNQARLDNEPWLKAVSTKSNWIFNSKQLRAKVLEAGGVH